MGFGAVEAARVLPDNGTEDKANKKGLNASRGRWPRRPGLNVRENDGMGPFPTGRGLCPVTLGQLQGVG